MDGEKDWLRIGTGILSLAFALYCLGLIFIDAPYFFILFIINAVIYSIYGITLLFRKKDSSFSFLPFVFVFGFSWGLGGMPWYIWPFFILPIIILVLSILMFIKMFKGNYRLG